MGIRYFAKAVTADRVERARHDPMYSVCCCPDEDYWDERTSPVPTLDLDKAWREIQSLLGCGRGWAGDRAEVRPAAELVRGYSNGMDTYRRLLAPDEVEHAASDLELFFQQTGRTPLDDDTLSSDFDYVETHLDRARRFASGLAGTGLWVYYSIG